MLGVAQEYGVCVRACVCVCVCVCVCACACVAMDTHPDEAD